MTFNEYIQNPTGKGSSVIPNKQLIHQTYQQQFDNLLAKENGNIMYHLYKDNNDFYIHLKIPSGITESFYYDTIIRFYPGKGNVRMEKTLTNYDIQVYSNDANFVFTYCYVFNKKRMFIKDLSNKMSKLALTQEPKIKNPKQELGYVKTLYFAYLEIKRQELWNKSKWDVTAKKYNKSVWINTVDHADDKIRTANELISADRKAKHKIDTKEKTKVTAFKKSSVPLTSKFTFANSSPNQKNFGHFSKQGPKKFSAMLKKEKIDKDFGKIKKP